MYVEPDDDREESAVAPRTLLYAGLVMRLTYYSRSGHSSGTSHHQCHRLLSEMLMLLKYIIMQ